MPYLRSEYGKDYDFDAPVKLLDKHLHVMAESVDEQLVVVSQVLVADINIGYEEIVNTQVLAFNNKPVKNLKSLADMVESCSEEFLKFDLEYEQVVMDFKMPRKVYKTAMCLLATSHMLIVAATEDVQVRLCDMASGAFSHTLSGHHDGVMEVEWSTSSKWVLMTGGCDGAIRLWDIRRAGGFSVLDQSNSQLGRRPPLLEKSTTKVSTSKSSTRVPHRKVASGSCSKHSGSSKVLKHAKGSTKKRLHPGLLSGQDRATTHYGAVIGLKATEDGMYLLSAGSDSRLRFWDIQSGCNTLVHYEIVRLQSSKPVELAVTQDSSTVFLPCMTSVKVCHLILLKVSLRVSKKVKVIYL